MALDPADTAPSSIRSASRSAVAFASTTVACAIGGWAVAQLEIAPLPASTLFPVAGIGLASVLVYGARMLPALGLGAFLAVLSGLPHVLAGLSQAAPSPFVVALILAAVMTLQVTVGATLIRHLVSQPLTLAEPADVGRFFAAAILASLIGAGGVMLVLAELIGSPLGTLPLTAAMWWLGDLAGLMIVAPVALTLIGEPRGAWAARRASVGLTLTLVTAVLVLGIAQTVQRNAERTRSAFDHEAASATLALATRLQQPLHALEAMGAVLAVSPDPARSDMHVAIQRWLDNGGLQAIGWSERVPALELASFEARNRVENSPGYRVRAKDEWPTSTNAGREAPPTAGNPPPAGEIMAIRFIEPLQGNDGALGLNALSVPAARAAIESTRRSGRPAATAGFRLSQQRESQTDVSIYQAVYTGTPETPAEREAATRGVAFVSLDMEAPLRDLAAQLAGHLHICIVDSEAGAELRRLAGPPGCEAEQTDMLQVRRLAFAGREWDVRVFARADEMPPPYSVDTWLFSLIGLFATALLAATLLTMTGRSRRIELAVSQRTSALEAQVGEREIAEAALRDSEQRFRNILDNVPIGVIYTNLAGDVIQANPRFCELVGHSEEDLLSLRLIQCTHPDDVAAEVEMAAQLVRGDIPMYRHHKRFLKGDGATVWVQSTVSLLRDSQNQPWRIVGVVEDITEHLRLEEAEHARETAEAANRAKSEFLSRMSHELRTPLNAMLGFAQLLELDQRHPLTEAQKPWVVQIQQAGWHLLEMINDVLDLSRIESGNLRLQIETLELTELIEASLGMVASDAQARRITVTQEVSEGSSALIGDATRVKQILTNLLSNAVKYNRDAGRIHIASRISGPETIDIGVTDAGLGMTPRQLTELFQPFNRLGRERVAPQGTGIGLVISQRLAELMGGSLRAESIAGQGSSFILTLPRAIDPDTVRSELDELESAPADYHRRLVHYVEDNETNVEVMRGILAQRPQVQLAVSITGLDGLAAIRTRRPDLILLDMHLPDISGLELLRHLKGDPETRAIPIVAVSADALAEQITEAMESGAERYLTKPVSVPELLGVVDTLLDRVDTGFR